MNSGVLGKCYLPGETIIRQGETGDCMFAIQRGRVEVLLSGKDGELQIAVMKEGEIFGEMAIFEREVRSATVRALSEARVLTVDRKTFLRRVQEDPSIAFNLARLMSARIRRLSAEIAELKPASPLISHGLSFTAGERKTERRRTPDRRKGIDRRKTADGSISKASGALSAH